MDWSTERIPKGGIFHPHKIKYSLETHKLLKLLMEEQKLTIFQRNKVNYHLRNGDALPIPAVQQKQLLKYQTNGNLFTNGTLINGKLARKRTIDIIKSSGAYDFERYTPKNQANESSEKQKIRLQECMSGVKHYPELDSLAVKNGHKYKNQLLKNEITPTMKINELLSEIYERVDWLAEMEEMGEGKQHRNIIQGQIAERLRKIQEIENTINIINQ